MDVASLATMSESDLAAALRLAEDRFRFAEEVYSTALAAWMAVEAERDRRQAIEGQSWVDRFSDRCW